jgi:hypothetical protein
MASKPNGISSEPDPSILDEYLGIPGIDLLSIVVPSAKVGVYQPLGNIQVPINKLDLKACPPLSSFDTQLDICQPFPSSWMFV